MSKKMACNQRLCGNAAFTIDFCVDLGEALQSGYNYSMSHCECGYVGQLLYLHMECHGMGATAIGCYLDDYASSNVGFLPKPIPVPKVEEKDDDADQSDDEEFDEFEDDGKKKKQKKKEPLSPDGLNRYDEWTHPLKNVRSLCHFSCGKPTTDYRYPFFAWDSEIFPL